MRVSDENRACPTFICFFEIMDPFDGRSFLMCSQDPFFGTKKNQILKNGSCERALTLVSGYNLPPPKCQNNTKGAVCNMDGS